MSHPTFTLDTWADRLPETVIHSASWFDSSSPSKIVATEHYRQLALQAADLGKAVPVDVFTFGYGEAPERHLTKVNGLPFRPKDRPWPVDRDGRPLTFLAQFCFADSSDHVHDLPGDVLLVFARTRRGHLLPRTILFIEPEEDLACLVFEWYSLGLKELVTAGEIPPLPEPPVESLHLFREEPAEPLRFATCFGVRYRSVDYVELDKAVSALRQVVAPNCLPSHKFYQQLALEGLACYPMMKIGGCPVWYDEPRHPHGTQFIAGFAGVTPISDVPYPWVNQPRPISSNESLERENLLRIGDPGYINLFVDKDGDVQWTRDALR